MAGELLPSPQLSEKEQYALDYHRNKREPSLAPVTQAQLFQLYLQGHDCDEIRRLRPNFSLGQIVEARVEGQWDMRRQEHVQRLMRATQEKVAQTQLESVEYICNLVAAHHRLQGDKLKRFLMSGDPKDLGDAGITSFKQYKEVLATLRELLKPAETVQRVTGEVTHVHRAEAAPEKMRVIEQEEQSSALEYLAGRKAKDVRN